MKKMIKKILFPFVTRTNKLQNKWWHRLAIVLSVVALSFSFFCSLAITTLTGDSFLNHSFTFKHYNLESFTHKFEENENTIPYFLENEGNLGCLKNNRIEKCDYAEYGYLKNNSYCNPSLSTDSFEEAFLWEQSQLKQLKVQFPGGDEAEKRTFKNFVENGPSRNCLISKKLDCLSSGLVKYEPNLYFFLEAILVSLVSTYLLSLLLQFIYYYGVVYVIFGNKK